MWIEKVRSEGCSGRTFAFCGIFFNAIFLRGASLLLPLQPNGSLLRPSNPAVEAVLGWRDAGDLFKDAVEVSDSRKAALAKDRGDVAAFLREQRTGSLDPKDVEKLFEVHKEAFVKQG